MTKEAFRKDLAEAELVLVGLGEEFDCTRAFCGDIGYREGKDRLIGSAKSWLLPAWMRLYREDHPDAAQACCGALERLAEALRGKNYFVVSVSVNSDICAVPWRENRLVCPCGSDRYVQFRTIDGADCPETCPERIRPLRDGEADLLREQLITFRGRLARGEEAPLPEGLPACVQCGEQPELCNIYHPSYEEAFYLDRWADYTKWLQGSLNRRLLILELGVGLTFPSVIRFPFERTACFHLKSRFYRVHENLYQLTPELAERGVSIPENAIDWLQDLC